MTDSLEEFQRKQREKKEKEKTATNVVNPVTKDEHEQPESRADNTIVHRGQEAWLEVKNQGKKTWSNWCEIQDALGVGRSECMRKADTNEPKGSKYNKLFGVWLREKYFNDIKQSDRKRCFDCLEHRVEITEFLMKMSPSERTKFNHPSTVWKKWQASTKPKSAESRKRKSPSTLLSPTLQERDRRIADLKGELKDVKEERDNAKEDLATANGDKPLTIDTLADALVLLLHGKPASVVQKEIKAFVQRVASTLAATKPPTPPKKSGKAKKTKPTPIKAKAKSTKTTKKAAKKMAEDHAIKNPA